MPLTAAELWVFALITSVVVPGGKLAGVQPSNRLSCRPTVAPLGPQAGSGMTPVPVVALKRPCTACGLSGSVTSRPPLQKLGPAKVQPGGLLAMVGIDV